MLRLLDSIIAGISREDFNDMNNWKSLYVDYHPPIVERLYMQVGDHRLYLHVIHKPEEADKCLFHKHPWPSVVRVLSGSYEMGISYSEQDVQSDEVYETLPMVAKAIIGPHSAYEMTHPHGIHYVRPISEISCSIMLTGPLFYPDTPKHDIGKKLEALSYDRKKQILEMFNHMWPGWSRGI
jgi:hypothetical protein